MEELYAHYDLLRTVACEYVIPDPEIPFENESVWVLKDEDRSCTIYIFGQEAIPKYNFEWDECSLFEISSDDTTRLGDLILHWVYHKLPPSKMKIQFPEIELGKLAAYYENGEGVKGEYIESWNDIEVFNSHFYSEEDKSREDDTFKLIKELRAIGLDRQLRAGQSLYRFILSRSRRHGLQENAFYIMITFLGNNQMRIHYYLNNKETSFQKETTIVTDSVFNNKEKSIESEVTYNGKLKELIEILLKEEIK